MATVNILVQGYATSGDSGERASSTAVLVRDRDATVVVDPGLARERLMTSLAKLEVRPEDVQFVLLTHHHPDHALGAGWFPQAKIIDCRDVFDGDRISQHDGFVPGTELAIMHTPGHSAEHCSLAVPTQQGMVVIAGDVFWWEDGEGQTLDVTKPDPYAVSQQQLQESREKVLKLADIIIPG
ncbi:MAG: MBL fold metallo-hydrolase, partial [Patescibacteria group bacterium]